MKNANGIHPIVALILTALVCVLMVVFFTGGPMFWGMVFAIIANMMFQNQQLHWNHAAAFLCIIAAVYFVFMEG